MHSSEIEWRQKGDISHPYTLFDLSSEEKMIFNRVKGRHAEMNGNLPHDLQERRDLEANLISEFLKLFGPYLASQKLSIDEVFVTYSDEREISVRTPNYAFFDESDELKIAFSVNYDFPTTEQRLGCVAKLQRHNIPLSSDQIDYFLLLDVLDKVYATAVQDDENSPLLKLTGNGLYFAPTSFAAPFMLEIRETLKSLGEINIQELQTLRWECQNAGGFDPENADVVARALKKGYDSGLELALISAGLQEKRLEAVE